MAAAVATSKISISVSNPFHVPRKSAPASAPPSRLPPTHASSSSTSTTTTTDTDMSTSDVAPKTFKRLRSSFEHSIRNATRSKAKSPPLPPDEDEFGTITATAQGRAGKGKEKEKVRGKGADVHVEETEAKDKEPGRSRVLRRLESKVTFRRTRKTSTTTPQPLPASASTPLPNQKQRHPPVEDEEDEDLPGGFTPFRAPSLRGASMSSPALHLSSQALPSPKSQPFAGLASHANGSSIALVSPERSKFAGAAGRSTDKLVISGPAPLTPRRGSGSTTRVQQPPSTPSSPTPPSKRKPRPPPLLPSSPSTPSLPTPSSPSSSRRPDSPPGTPTPTRTNLSRTRTTSPSPTRTPAPPRRPGAVYRGVGSVSTSHLPLENSSARRGSIESQRRPSVDRDAPSPLPNPRRGSVDAPRRPSIDAPSPSPTPRRASVDAQRPRAVSPTTPTSSGISRPRALSPALPPNRARSVTPTHGAPMSPTVSSDDAAAIQSAAALLVRELLRPAAHLALGRREADELEARLGGLARVMKIGRGGGERERRAFGDAVRDGYVLCHLMNKLRPGSITRIDAREDGRVRTGNTTRFLAACTQHGLASDALFRRDDLLEGTADALARVARTVLALARWAEGGGVYGTQRGAASTPNLALGAPRKRASPPAPALPTVRAASPEGSSSDGRTAGAPSDGEAEADDVPPIVPPRSPLRLRVSVADSMQASVGDEAGRQSMASSVATEGTGHSSFWGRGGESSGGGGGSGGRFGTMRTATTEATSFVPEEYSPQQSFGKAEGSALVVGEEGRRLRGGEAGPASPVRMRERRPSESAGADLTRVQEEVEDGYVFIAGREPERDKEKEKIERIKLGKGKWPDDFLDVLQASASKPVPIKTTGSDADLAGRTSTPPLSVSPPRKLAIVTRNNESLESLPQFPSRRPSHRARHSVDAPVLLPKESPLRREASPDAPSGRAMLRRSSTKTGAPLAQRSGSYVPRRSITPEEQDHQDGATPVPFPRAVSGSGENTHGASTPTSADSEGRPRQLSASRDRQLQPRGRFQSEVDGESSRRRPRPNSYDEFGAKGRRSRFESMVNLGAASGNASASDLLARDSMDGSAVRQTLVVKEEGKTATQYQLGNCIGRGQFGSVYRALNLNTGQMVAVKRIGLEGLKEEEVTQLMREVDLVKSLSHPSIVKYEGMARDEMTLSIVLEYAENGSLGQTLKAFGKLNERLVASYVVKILEGLHYLHQSDVVHCDLKAANILTTKNGNVKLSDFGVSLNLRAMEREIKDVAGTPNWMAPEVIELKGASTKSDIWSLACTVIELLTGRPPYGDVANAMTVMFRIVEDEMPPIPEGCSPVLLDFLKLCFNKDPALRPSAELLCEHPWLKKHWGAHMDLRPQDSIPFLRRVSADLAKNSDVVRHLAAMDITDPPLPERPRLDDIVSGSPGRRSSNGPSSPIPPGPPDSDLTIREHTFVKTTFSKPVVCRVCMENVKKSAVLCSQCSLICHTKCASRAPPTCDLRSQLLLYAQFAERGTPVDFISAARGTASATTPASDGFAAESSRASLDTVGSPSLQSSAVNPPSAYKVLQPFKRSRASLSPEPARSASSASLAHGTHGTKSPPPLPREENVIRRKLSILTRSRDTRERDRPRSISSVSTARHTSSMRSMTTTGESLSSRSRRVGASIAETDNSAAASDIRRSGTEDSARPSKLSSGPSTIPDQEEVDVARVVPGGMPTRSTSKRGRDAKSASNNCLVQ